MKILTRLGLLLITIILLSSCDGFEKVLKSTDFDAKYKAAMEYYNNNNYTKAIQLFENLIVNYHGKENAENIGWYYSMSLLKEKDYYSAGYQFSNFTKRFPYSEHCEEALYLAANCKFRQSPEYNLDQRLTKEAITAYESFVDRYPGSVHIPEINDNLDILRNKLMLKDYSISYGYFETENYNAAYHSFQSFLNNYPDSPKKEDAMYYQLASSYQYAINSRESKMRERLQQVINDFEKFNSTFRESKYTAQAQSFYSKAKEALTKLETQNK